MMKKIRGFSLILCAYSVLAGCNKSSVDIKEKAGEEIVSMEEAEYSFPEKYEKTSDSGKVKFNCELEVPENIKGQAISTVDVKGLYSCDREKAWTIFGEGKEIIEKSEIPVNEGRAPEDYYLFANDECLDINEGITYGSSNSKYYLSIGARNSNNQVVFEESDNKALNDLLQIMEKKRLDYTHAAKELGTTSAVVKKFQEQGIIQSFFLQKFPQKSCSGFKPCLFKFFQQLQEVLI